MLEQRNDVGECLVERRHIRIGRFLETPVQPVEQRMRHFVGDDVAGQAGEDRRAWRRGVAITAVCREIAEQQRLLVRAVIGVVGSQRVRIDAQARHFIGLEPLVAAPDGVFAVVGRPQRAAAERPLEMADRGHGDGINHLLVKLRIALRRRQTTLGEKGLVVQVDRVIDPVRGRIDIHDFEIFANRTRPQRLGGSGLVIPGNRQRRLMHRNGIEALGHRRIERIDTQLASGRRRRTRLAFDRCLRPQYGLADRHGGRPPQYAFEKGSQRLRRIALVERGLEVAVAGSGRDGRGVSARIGDRFVDRFHPLRHLGQLQRQHASPLVRRWACHRQTDAAANKEVEPAP